MWQLYEKWSCTKLYSYERSIGKLCTGPQNPRYATEYDGSSSRRKALLLPLNMVTKNWYYLQNIELNTPGPHPTATWNCFKRCISCHARRSEWRVMRIVRQKKCLVWICILFIAVTLYVSSIQRDLEKYWRRKQYPDQSFPSVPRAVGACLVLALRGPDEVNCNGVE